MRDTTVALGQGLMYVVTGVWPLVHLPSFLRVTGPKVDTWLVKTVGALVACVGVALVAAARRGRVTPELGLAATGCALSLATVDVVYVARRRISPVYLLDAVVELALVGGWLLAWRRGRGH